MLEGTLQYLYILYRTERNSTELEFCQTTNILYFGGRFFTTHAITLLRLRTRAQAPANLFHIHIAAMDFRFNFTLAKVICKSICTQYALYMARIALNMPSNL